MSTLAEALIAGDKQAAARLAAGLLKPRKDNFVQRPWGGAWLPAYKGLAGVPAPTVGGCGEAFEIAACEADPEARAHPSRLRLTDGSEIALDVLLQGHAQTLLGQAFAARYGASFPLLPKTLDIKELLSVQGHPAGHTEAYVIIDAEPGATIRLGFRDDVDARGLAADLNDGRRTQQALLAGLVPGIDQHALQRLLAPWLSSGTGAAGLLRSALEPLVAGGSPWARIEALLAQLRARFWSVLDLMNELPVTAGQIIHNSTPSRLCAPGRAPAAEVHALGDPERREILMLEVRRPGPTLRAWDHARFPLREIDVEAALATLNLRGTRPEEFIVEPCAVPGKPGLSRSIDSPYFRLEHLRLGAEDSVDFAAEPPHTLHATGGRALIDAASGARLGTLGRGESALVPVGVGAYRVTAGVEGAQLVKANLPCDS